MLQSAMMEAAMQDYDVVLKLLLLRSAKLTIRELTGTTIEKWLDVELPKVQNIRMDLLGETAEGELIHFELQSRNEADMVLRMHEYCVGVRRLCGRFPRQILLYVGAAPMRMETEHGDKDIWFRYHPVDVRELDSERLLASEDVGDNIIAILTRLRDHKDAVRRIVESIQGSVAIDRETALQALLILAGLRGLEQLVDQEARKMPIYIDIRENKVLGPAYSKGLQEGELALLRRLIQKRFGAIPDWAEEKLTSRTAPELEELGVRVLDAHSLEDLLQ